MAVNKSGSLGGYGSRLLSTMKTVVNNDGRTLGALERDAKSLRREIKNLKEELKELEKVANGAGAAVAGVVGSKGSASPKGPAGTKMQKMSTAATRADRAASEGDEPYIGSTKMVATKIGIQAISRMAGGGGLSGLAGAGGAAAAGAGAAVGAYALAKGYNMVADASSRRMARSYDYALSADQMSVMYQQMTGKSMLDVSSTYRMPLTQYRLGFGGINQLMSMEAATGISGRQQASSVEAMRTLSGYQLDTGNVTSMIGSLASAPTANRMFMMGGIGLVGVGGKQRSLMDVMKNITKAAGLTDEKVINSAFAPGSVTRSKLSLMGVPQEMQTQVLQYAKANLEYQQKGGSGMYDPSREKDRRLMGIEENFATQREESDRLEVSREEKFYRRQADNFAYLERQTQTLTRAFGALEDRLSGIVGFTGSNVIANSLIGGMVGDPPRQAIESSARLGDPAKAAAPSKASGVKNDNNIYVPLGDSGKRVSIAYVKSRYDFKNMNPKMQERLLNLMRDNPDIGWGGGVRSSDAQKEMFLSRYNPHPTKEGSDWEWPKDSGRYWKKKDGVNPAAPPGSSMHELGLAADLAGNLSKLTKVAAKYGLKHFSNMTSGSEPWHVQPAELPDGRASYEAQGAKWGFGPGQSSEEIAKSVDTGSLPTAPLGGTVATGTVNPSGTPMGGLSVKSTPMGGASIGSTDTPAMGMYASSISARVAAPAIRERVSSQADTGDPVVSTPLSGSMYTPVPTVQSAVVNNSSASPFSGNVTFNINPTINMQGNGSTMDLKKIAQELSKMIRKELEVEMLRKI